MPLLNGTGPRGEGPRTGRGMGYCGPGKHTKPYRVTGELGTGFRFGRLKGTLAAKGARSPGGLAAWIGRRKYGKARFQRLAAKG